MDDPRASTTKRIWTFQTCIINFVKNLSKQIEQDKKYTPLGVFFYFLTSL